METAAVPSAPAGRYVVFEFHAKYSNRALAIESVVETLCEDGSGASPGTHCAEDVPREEQRYRLRSSTHGVRVFASKPRLRYSARAGS